jgi:hypothetical protein
MMRGFVADLGQTVKRPLSDREIAAIGEVLSSVGLIRDRRKGFCDECAKKLDLSSSG